MAGGQGLCLEVSRGQQGRKGMDGLLAVPPKANESEAVKGSNMHQVGGIFLESGGRHGGMVPQEYQVSSYHGGTGWVLDLEARASKWGTKRRSFE